MQTLRLGELSLIAQASGIRFMWDDDRAHSVLVPADKIATLKAFLDEHHADERRLGFRVPLRPLSGAVRVALSLHDDQVRLTAVVVRSNQKLVALHFPSCVKNGELDPPEELLAIYRTLELDWLKSRKL